MARHTSQARKVARELDKLLAAVGDETGVELGWDATEVEIIGLIMAAIDRKVALSSDYENADDAKIRVKLSGELRLTETHIARLLKQIKPAMPPAVATRPTTQRSGKARLAAQARWQGAS
jgi:hypothetical protein